MKEAAAKAAERAKALAARAKAATKKGADSANDAGEACLRRHSFVAGTRVLTADGRDTPIERVEPGDAVLATDPASGRTGTRQVTRTISTDDDKEFVDLSVREGSSEQKLTTTAHHPFWSATRGRWVDAGDLRPGELLRTSAGTYVQVGSVKHYEGHQRTYDLTVDTTHTYYVLAGNTPVLVHNCGTSSVDELRNANPIDGHGLDPDKVADMKTWSDDDLLNSFNNPRDGGVARINDNGTIVNGHHRINEIISRADDPTNTRITGGTTVRVDGYSRDLSDFWDMN